MLKSKESKEAEIYECLSNDGIYNLKHSRLFYAK